MIRLGAAFGFLGVALGAFGAHGLRDHLPPQMFEAYKTGVLYHLLHAVALVAVGAAATKRPAGASAPTHPPTTPLASLGLVARPRAVATLFAAGIVIFSGSLYAYALTGAGAFGAVAPVGGLLLMAGWVTLALNR